MTDPLPMTRTVRISRRGRFTIPAEFRKRLGNDEMTELRMTLADDELRVRPVASPEPAKGSPWLRELYEHFAPAREKILRRGISEEELNADIDTAIAEVRAEQRAKRQPDSQH